VRSNKQEKILKIAAAMMSRDGFRGTSFQQIADRAGLHKSSLFHYFKNKEDLLLRILEKSIDKASADLEAIIKDPALNPEQRLEKAILNHLTLLIRYSDNVNIYLNELRSLSKKHRATYLEKRKRYERDMENIVVQLRTKGHFEGLNTKIVTFGLLGMMNWAAKWYKRGGLLDQGEIARIFYKMVL